MEKMAWDGPKWGREDFFPTNPGLVNILGRTGVDFENFHFFILWIPNFWISRFPDFQNLAWAGLGPWAGWALGWAKPGLGQARPGLSHLDPKMLIFHCKYWCLSSRPAVSSRRDESKCHQVLFFPDQNERQVPADLTRPLTNTVRTPHRIAKLCLGNH